MGIATMKNYWSRVRGVFLAALLGCVLLGGCATQTRSVPTNSPIISATPHQMGMRSDFVRENAIVLSLSGGGLRAAAFSLGVLNALRETKTNEGDLLDDVAIINSVSGSALTAAYFGLYGRDGLDAFEESVLTHGFESDLKVSFRNPANIFRLLGGGLNTSTDFAALLDRSSFGGATFGDLYQRTGPDIRIHATDLYHRIAFPFMPQAFSLLCSDISQYRIADAVAASMAVPLFFSPVVVRTYPQACSDIPKEFEHFIAPPATAPKGVKAIGNAVAAYKDKHQARYLRLVDGGLIDNFGVSTLVNARAGFGSPYAPLSTHEALTVRRLLFIVVDATSVQHSDWIFESNELDGIDVMIAASDAAVDSSARQASDLLEKMIHEWQESVITFRCGLTTSEVDHLGGPEDWNCRDVKFSVAHISINELPEAQRRELASIPTRLSLTKAEIQSAINAASSATRNLPEVQLFLGSRIDTKERTYNTR